MSLRNVLGVSITISLVLNERLFIVKKVKLTFCHDFDDLHEKGRLTLERSE